MERGARLRFWDGKQQRLGGRGPGSFYLAKDARCYQLQAERLR